MADFMERERPEEPARRAGGDADQRTERWRYWLRGSVSTASLLLLIASVALFSAEHHADGRRAGLRWTALAAGATQQLADLTFYERFMQRLATLNSNSTGAANATDCPEGEECIPAEAVRVSALQIANNLAGDWLVRTRAKDQHPYQFCAEYTDLSAKEMRACVRHLMRPLELARGEAISHNSTNASVQLALQNNFTFNVSDEHGWDACYEAWEDQEDKETCVTFVSNRLEGDVAFACSQLDSPEEFLKCGRVKQAVDNIKSLILRQKVMPVSDALNGTIMKVQDREQAIREMQESENKTEDALQAMSPELQNMLAKTIEISAESNNKLTAMERAINDTLLSGPQTVIDRLGPKPGPFGELPGKVEHEYMVNKTLAANRSAVAEESAAAAANSSVEATKIVMRAIISRKYNGAGDAARALRLMNSSSSASANTAVEEVKGSGEQAVLDGTPTQLGAAAHTSSLLQVGGGMQGGRSIAARVQGLVQLEKLAEHGNLGDLDSIMDHNVQWQHAGLTPEEKADAKVAIAFGDDGFNMHRHREGDNDLQTGSGLNSALDGFSHLLLSHNGPALHVALSSEFRSAADIASQFNADSVPTLLNLAGSEASDNDDLTSVMEGTVQAPHVPPPRALVDKALIAKEFKDDAVGKVASSRAEQQGQGTGWMQRFYNNLKSEGNANRDVEFFREATAVTAARRSQLRPRAVAQVKEARRRGERQHAPATATKRAKPFNPYGYTHAQEDPVAKDPVAKEEETSMNSLWSKLLKEEAMATAAKHQAHVAKKQATLAALKIKEQKRAKAQEAVQQEEAKLRRDEHKVLDDRQKAKTAKKLADLLAHKLAEDKFAEMQEVKRATKALEARNATAKKLGQQSAAQRAEFQKAKAAMMEQAREDVTRAQQHQPHHVRVQAATQPVAWRETSAHIASPPVEQLQTSTRSNNPVLSRGTSQIEASHGTGSGGDQEAAIVATVKRLEDKAEREPVVTRQERQEQRAEVKDAKKLLQQAAWLREHAAHAATNRAPASDEPTVTPVHRIRSKQQLRGVRNVKRQEHEDAQPAQIQPRASRPAARSPDAAVAEDAPSQHGRIWDGVTWDGVVASPSQAAQAEVQHRQEAPPVQAVAPSAPAASAPATATSVVQRSVVQGLPRQREKPREKDAEPPVAQQLPPSVDGSNLGDLLNLMNTPPQSSSSIKPHDSNDGLGDSLSGLGDDRKIQKLRNDDMSAAGLIAAAPVQAEKRFAVAGVAEAPPLVPAPVPSKPSALSPTQIMEAKIRKENEAEDAEEARVKGLVDSLTAGDNIDDDDDGIINHYNLGSHLHSAQVLPLLLSPPACLHALWWEG